MWACDVRTLTFSEAGGSPGHPPLLTFKNKTKSPRPQIGGIGLWHFQAQSNIQSFAAQNVLKDFSQAGSQK